MAFTHQNKVTTSYTAGGVLNEKSVTKNESADAEINISASVANAAGAARSGTIDIPEFNMTDGGDARSVFLMLDGYAGTLYASGIGSQTYAGGTKQAFFISQNSKTILAPSGNITKIKDLADGEPYVWSYNGGSNFPASATNPLPADDQASVAGAGGISGIFVIPNDDVAAETACTLTVRVLYDPTP